MTYALSPPEEWSLTTPKTTPLSWWKSIRPLSHLTNDLGIDLGTSNTLIYSPHQGIVLQESSVIAIHQFTRAPIAVGTTARQLLGRTSAPVRVCRPVRNGVVADLELTQLMLHHFILKAQQGARIFRPRLVMGCSCGATDVERKALTEAALEAGAREVVLIDEPVAAAIGAGLPAEKPRGNLIVDIGGGTTEMAIVCSSQAVYSQAIPVAGDTFSQSISAYLRQTYQVHIGELTAESLKIQYGSVTDSAADNAPIQIVGVHIGSGLPQRLSIDRGELRDALSPPLHKVAVSLLNLLEKISPELVTDISERGIMLTGGGALLSGIDTFIQDLTSLPVHVAQDPLHSVVLGTGSVLQGSYQPQVAYRAA